MSKNKKIIIGSVIGAVLLVSALAILIFNNIKKERELQEAIKLEQEQKEKEAQELKEQQEQEEKEHQERLAKLEEGWNALGKNQEYLTLGSDHLKRTSNSDGTVDFSWSVEFIGSLYMINDGVFNGIKKDELNMLLGVALQNLPDNATGKEVYDALVKATELFDMNELKNTVGEDPLAGLIQTEPESTQQQTSNNSGSTGTSGGGSTNKNNGASGGGSNNNNNTGGSSTPPNDDSDEGSGGSSFAEQFGGSQVEGDPEDHKDPNADNSPVYSGSAP